MEPLIAVVRRLRYMRAWLKLQGRIRAGAGFIIGGGFRPARGVSIVAGNRVSLGRDVVCHDNLTLGDDIMVSSNVGFVGDDHPFDDSPRTLVDFPARGRSTVTLGGDNLIGFGAIIVGPVHIGKGAIVAAGAVVVSDVPENTVVGGVPARLLRMRR